MVRLAKTYGYARHRSMSLSSCFAWYEIDCFAISLTPAPSRRRISPYTNLSFGMWSVSCPAPLRGAPVLADKKVLLIDPIQHTREARASFLRSHGVEVHEADCLQAARFLWQPIIYDLILLNVRGHFPGDALEFYEQVKSTSHRERLAFLV